MNETSSEPPHDIGEQAAPRPDEIRVQLAKILKSEGFCAAKRLSRFLIYVIEKHLNGKSDQLKEYDIGLAVFDKDQDFDPSSDRIVSRTAARLRDGLATYYETAGKDDPLLIELPKGRYITKFAFRSATHGLLEPPATQAVVPVRRFPPLSPWPIAVLVLLVAAVFLWHTPPAGQAVLNDTRPRRLFAVSTSEGRSPVRIETGLIHDHLQITPDGKKLYAFSSENRTVIVLSVDDLQVKRTFELPFPRFRAFQPRNGRRIYVSANNPDSGVMVVDTVNDRVVRVIPTGAPALGIAVTPDERKVFLAQGDAGLKVIDLETGASRILSPLTYPRHLDLDPAGRRLYVSYQRGGPGGSPGHDAVDIYDIDSEKSVGVINGLPMVGSDPTVSPKGELVLLDGGNACSSPEYDHVGCLAVPSYIFHLWQASGRRVIATIPPQMAGEGTFSPQDNRILFVGDDITVWDWARGRVSERVKLPGLPPGIRPGKFVISTSGGRAFTWIPNTKGLLVFDAEREECLLPNYGLSNFYPGDGTMDDSQGTGSLKPTSPFQFAPGKVGQAFHFDGKGSFLTADGPSSFCTWCQDSWTESLWVKFESTGGEMTIMDAAPGPKEWERLYKSENNHIVLQGNNGPVPRLSISSVGGVKAGRWYHLAVVHSEDHVSFYFDGALQGQIGSIGIPVMERKLVHVFFGASQGKRNLLNGLIDEVALYNRALRPDEVKKIAETCNVAR